MLAARVSMGEELTTDPELDYLWDERTAPMTATEPMTTIRMAFLPIEGGVGAWEG